jgi:hypothetical protein
LTRGWTRSPTAPMLNPALAQGIGEQVENDTLLAAR